MADVFTGYKEALIKAGHKVLGFPMNDLLAFFDGAFLQQANTGPLSHQFRKATDIDGAIEMSVDRLAATLYKTHPDVMILITGSVIPTELLDLARHRGTRVVLVHTESPYEDGWQAEHAAHADLNLVNDPTNLDRFPAGTIYMPHAYRPTVHCPGRPIDDLRSDLAFVGTAFGSRIRFFEAMDFAGADVCLAGNWQRLDADSPLRKYVIHENHQCLDNEAAVQVYRSAKVGLNYYRREGDDTDKDVTGWSMGPREVELAATGLFFLRDPRPEGDELLPMLPTFTSPAEASDLLAHWLAHPAERLERAAAAREAVADRTFDHNAATLMHHLEGTT